jgi:ankyrin repeat protein
MEAFFGALKEGNEPEVTRLLDEDPSLLERVVHRGTRRRPLAVAARYGQLGVVRLLMERGAEMSARGKSGSTALHWAAGRGHEEVVSFLLEQGAQPNIANESKKTPLMLACEKGHLGGVQALAQHLGGQRLDKKSRFGKTALHFAAEWGHEEVVKFLLGQGAQASSSDVEGIAPLMLACKGGHMGIVRLLVQHMGGQGLDSASKEGWTSLCYAAYAGHEEVVKFLLSNGAQALRADNHDRTPFMLACEGGHLGIVRLLVQHMGGQGLDSASKNGWTSLCYAAYAGHEEVVKFLLSNGAQALRADNHDRTPFMLACKGGHMGAVRLLAQHMGGQGLDSASKNGWTSLCYAASAGREEVVKFLLSNGAQASRADNYDRTPFMLACEGGHLGIVRLLVQHVGLQALQETDKENPWTALHAAAERGHEEVLTFLLEQGAQANAITTYDQRTPLMVAVEAGQLSIVTILLQRVGLRALKETDEEGKTALLQWACRCRTHPLAMRCVPNWEPRRHFKKTADREAARTELMAFLLRQGAQANSSDDMGRTPLMLASEWRHVGEMRLLLQHMGGEGLDRADERGRTALHWAAFGGCEEAAALLLGEGVNGDIRDADGRTPLMLACHEGCLGVMRVLLSHTGTQVLQAKDAGGKTALHLAVQAKPRQWRCQVDRGAVVRALLLAGADPTITDNEGRTARAIAEGHGSRPSCVAAFKVVTIYFLRD